MTDEEKLDQVLNALDDNYSLWAKCDTAYMRHYVSEAKQALIEMIREAKKVTGETSDGFHSFDELYEYRMVYNALLFNEWAKQDKYSVHKSRKHSDGEPCFDGSYFIVMAELPTGQVSNHYKMRYWDVFQIPERETADEWDGHTPQEALDRLINLNKES